MSFRFENLEVWQIGRVFTNEIYTATKGFPKDEVFGLTNQLRRAAVSVILNIAEGSDRKSDLEFIRFLRISMASLEEVVSGLYIAMDQGWLTQDIFQKLYNSANQLASKLHSLIHHLSKSRSQ